MGQGEEEAFRSGFVTVAGRPNVGKSTFLNRVLGQKVAIVSPRPQTTRTRILGVHHGVDCQVVFVDTPGIHQGPTALNRELVRTAQEACRHVDLLLYFVEAARGVTEDDWRILARLPVGDSPVFLVINKVDRMPDQKLLLPLMAKAGEGSFSFAEVFPLSARNGDGLQQLLAAVEGRMPSGPHYFPGDQVSDQSVNFLASEVIREKLFLFLGEELPYSVAVTLENFAEENGKLFIQALILVERESQKGIVVGRGGEMAKKVGMAARKELASLFGLPVMLNLWVRVRKNWSDNPRALRELGLSGESDGGEA